MTFRGWFALNGVEIANSSRVVAHIGAEVPDLDLGLIGAAGDCSLTPIPGKPLQAAVPASSAPIGPGRLLYTPPDGSRMYSHALALVGDCWTPDNMCFGCGSSIGYDDSWEGLSTFLDDSIYRPELAPWYTTRIPESAEFGGIWVMDVKGLDVAAVQREVIEMVSSGGAPGPHRDPVRKVTFDALLIACSNAGLTYGLQWLTCALRDTNDRIDSTLRYLTAHPGHSSADPTSLVREVHGVVLTSAPTPQDLINTSGKAGHQAAVARVQWELAVSQPYSYMPPVDIPVTWDTVETEPIKWVHSAECKRPAKCDTMPALFAQGCDVEQIEIVLTPPPACGGCMPVCSVMTHVFQLPNDMTPYRCRETTVSMSITNLGEHPLSLQGYWRRCNSWDECEMQLWPVQVTGLPSSGELVLDAISEVYWVNYHDRKRRPYGMVSTPTGAPWIPPVLDRAVCYEFVVIAASTADFDVTLRLADRES